MIINANFDSSVAAAPTGFITAVNNVVQYFESQFTDSVTINIAVGFGEVNGTNLGAGALGESLSWGNDYTYAQIKGAVIADAKSADDASVVHSLGATDPVSVNHTYFVTQAEAEALGLSGPSTHIDGAIGFASAGNTFDFNNNNGVTAGQYDFAGVVMHELSEVMGRQAGLSPTSGYELMDLLRYSSPGTHDFVGTDPAYLSLDNGQTQLVSVNTNPNGDFGDWAASAGNDAAVAFGNPGVAAPFTEADLRLMDALGWDRASAAPPPPPVVPDRDVTVYDTQNNQTWASEIFGYDAQNRLNHLTLNNRDGTTTLNDYNPSHAENFQFAVSQYDTNGQLSSASIYPSNDPNHALFVTVYDPEHVHGWKDAISGYDAAGALDYVTVEKSDGTTAYTKYDHTPGDSIADTVYNYDANNHLVSTYVQHHDGSTLLV